MTEKEWKKRRRFRQSFARLLQNIARKPLLNPPYKGPLNSVIILAQEKLGDAVLLTPLVGNLRKAFPDLAIHLMVFSQPVFDFFSSDRNVTALHHAKKQPRRYIKDVLCHRFDVLYNTKDHPSTNFLLQTILVPARIKAGINNAFHEGLYDLLADIDYHAHIVTKNCALLDLLGITHTPESCRPYIPEMEVKPELAVFAGSLGKESGIVGLNISAGNDLRYWTEENWRLLIKRFPAVRFMVFSAPEDLEMKRRLETAPNVIRSPETRNLYEVGLLVRKLRMLVTPDTSIIHVASCFGVPVIGLYRNASQDLSRFAPYRTEHTLLASPTTRVGDISVDNVVSAIAARLSEENAHPRQ